MAENNKEQQPVSWVEEFYADLSDKQKQQFPDVAKVMVQTGAAKEVELDFILGKFPAMGKDWVEANPDVQQLMQMEEFSQRGGQKYLSWILVRTKHLTYDHIYRALQHSPLRPWMGDYLVNPPARPYFDGDNQVRVKVVESDADLTDIWKACYIEQGFVGFSLDAPTYLQSLKTKIITEQDRQKAQALQGTYDFYCQVQNLQFPSLHTQLPGKRGQVPTDKLGHPINFPTDHQKAAIVKAGQEGSLAVFDGTGSGKTGIGIGFVEYIGAKRALVVCPKSVAETWQRRISKEYYRSNPGAIRIDSQHKRRVANGEKYTVVNYELLINRGAEGQKPADILSPLAHRLLQGNFNALILDEAHYINNSNGRSEAILELAKKIDHILILTATPLRNSVDDLSRIVYLLAPNKFPTPEALQRLGQSGMPALVEFLTTKTIRRKTEDLQQQLPDFCPENNGELNYLQLHLNPTQKAVYNAIFDDPAIDQFSRIRLLRMAAIDHNLVRGGKHKLPFEEQQAARDLQKAYQLWLKRKEKVSFNSDYLVTHGFRHLFIGTHLQYKKGMDYFMQKFGRDEVKAVWSGVVESTKFQKIGELVRQRLARGEKVVIFSSHFKRGILREMIDDVTGEVIEQDLYNYLKKEFPQGKVGRIDGDIPANAPEGKISERESERQRWQNDPNYQILLTNIATSGLGIDLTVDDTVTTSVGIIGLDLPYTNADLWQMIARVYRPGQHMPVNAWIFEGIGTIDQGLHDLVGSKGNIAEELFDGLTANEMQRQLFDRSKTESNLVEYITSPRRELEKMFISMRGQGVVANGAELQKVLKDGRTFGETMAELYSRYWEYTYSGHTARLLQQVIDGLRKGQNSKCNLIVDTGSGPLILERTMRQESEQEEGLRFINVDINRHMLENGLAELQNLGYGVNRSNTINKPMSETGLMDGVADAVTCSLAFHYSNSTEDRGKILAEANRILRTGGYYFITLPEGYLTSEQFKAFGEALKKFGFELDKTISGQAKAVDHKDVPFAIWLIAARKIGSPAQDNLTMEEFRFNFEGPKISRYKGENEGNGHVGKQKEGQDRLVKHEKFLILDPDNLKVKGSPAEVLSRSGLGLTEEKLQKGWRMELTKDGVHVVVKNN